MTSTATATAAPNLFNRRVLNKVPEVTIFFWIIKILCTTVGESAADFLNVNMNWGLTATSIATGVALAVALGVQLSMKRYLAGVYWLTVVLVSVFGTLITDNLTDNLGVPLETSSVFFSVMLAAVFAIWYASEHTLSIHSIFTRRRESFYWLAVLVTFALGTAIGDLISEGLGVGYFWTGVLCAVVIALTTLAWRLGLNAVLAFWIAYILTRPLGASIGDFLAQPRSAGGLGLGVTVTSAIFLTAILVTIIYLSVRKPDVTPVPADAAELEELEEPETYHHHHQSKRVALIQTIVVVGLLVVSFGAFYVSRTNALDAQAAETTNAVGTTASPLGDVTEFVTITSDTLDLVNSGQQAQATARITDLETAWDASAATLQRRDKQAWTAADDKIDAVLRALRSTSPDPATQTAALQALLVQFGQ